MLPHQLPTQDVNNSGTVVVEEVEVLRGADGSDPENAFHRDAAALLPTPSSKVGACLLVVVAVGLPLTNSVSCWKTNHSIKRSLHTT